MECIDFLRRESQKIEACPGTNHQSSRLVNAMTITILALDVPERPRIIKLPRNGPKPGQSVEAWLYGKNKNCQRERDAAQWGKAKRRR